MLFETAESTILFWLLVGLATFVVTLAHMMRSPKGTVGLPVALLLSLMFVHMGAAAHLFSGYFHQYNLFLNSLGYTRNSVALGLQVSTCGFVAMAFGLMVTSHFGQPHRLDIGTAAYPARFLRLAERSMIGVGLLFLVAVQLVPALTEITTLGSLFVTGKNLYPVGLCLAIFRRVRLGEGLTLLQIGLLSAIIPLANLLGNAILAEAVTSVIVIGCFWLAVAGHKMGLFRTVLVIATSTYLFLFLSINYLVVRNDFRDIVWEPSSTLEERVIGLGDAIGQFGAISSENQNQLYMLDARLNQSLFTGMAVEQLREQPDGYENGATLLTGLFAWVPRVIWTTKPVRGGNEFLTRHTGYVGARETTYGIGPFFEFYANFGLMGTLFFSFLFGVLVRAFDLRAYRGLATGRMSVMVPMFVGGIALIQPLAMMTAVFSTLFASLIVGYFVAKMLERYLDIRRHIESQALV